MFIKNLIDLLVVMSTDYLIPAMLTVFVLSIVSRILIWWTVKREYWFCVEFEKRIQRYMNSVEKVEDLSFFAISKRLLEITFYEIFEVRSIMKRRNPDVIMDWMDRLFLIQQGCARTINDVLRKIRFMKFDGDKPDFVELSKSVSQNNPCFNRMFGIIPISGLNDLLNIIPNLFIIGGILGTFLGVMNALPELGGMDLANAENSKVIMETFLIKISFSMSTSIAGIVLSVIMTIVNTFFSAYKISVNTVDSLNESMGTLWAISHHNLQDGSEPAFDSSKDPLLVLAEDSIVAELNVQPGFIKLTRPIQGWWLKKSEKEDENDQAEGSKTQEKQPEQEEVKEVDRRTTGYTGGGLDITDPTINAEKTTSADANISKEEEKEIEKKDPTEDPAADNVA